MSGLPLHLQFLVHLRSEITSRKTQLEERTGGGLPDQDYQRHVGRIAECKNQLEMIAVLMKSGLEEIEDHEDNSREQRTKAARGSARRTRTTQ